MDQNKYLSATLLMLYIKFPALVATHILGRLTAVYLTESRSIKMRLPSHLDSRSYVAEHSKDSGHNIDWFNVKIITRD